MSSQRRIHAIVTFALTLWLHLGLPLATLCAWPGSASAAQFPAPGEPQILWQRTLDDAVAVSSAESRPLFVAINFDGESASDRIVTERYRDPAFVASTRRYACVVASVARHNPRDFDPLGRRIPCPRLGEVTCGEHIALEPILFDRYLGGERISPRHAVVQPDGQKSFDLFLLFDLKELDTELARFANTAPERVEPIALPTVLDKRKEKNRLKQWRTLAAQKTSRERAGFEYLVRETQSEPWIGEALDAIVEVGDAGSIGILRGLLSRDPTPSPALLGRIGDAAQALKVGPEVAAIVREKLASLGKFPGWPSFGDDRALLPLLVRFGGHKPAVRSFLLAHQAIGLEADRVAAGRALAPSLSTGDVTRVAAAIEAEGGACELPDLLVFANEVGRAFPRVEKPAPPPLATDELERELGESDQVVAADPKNPLLQQRFGRASLELGRRYAEAGGGNAGLLFEDARTWLGRAAEARPNDVKLAFDRAKVAYFSSRFEEQEQIALKALGGFPRRDALDPRALVLVDPRELGDGDVRRAATLLFAEDKLEALRWIGDAAARLLTQRASGDLALEVAGYLRGTRALALVAASPSATEIDWLSLASYLAAIGFERESLSAFELGAIRWPESNDLRAGLNRTLWAAARLDLAPVKAEWIQARNPQSAACAWHSGYASVLFAEDARREQRMDIAIDAYARAGRLFEESVTLRPDYERDAAHYAALSHLGTGFAHLALGRREDALAALASALQRSATVLDARDGLDRDVPDLIDALLEWRDGRKSPLDPLVVAETLAAAYPSSPRPVSMVSDAELREALRADGRSLVTSTSSTGESIRIASVEGDEYMIASIAIARRAVQMLENDETRTHLAQSLTVQAERWLERDAADSAAPLLDEAVRMLGLEPPAAGATIAALNEKAEELRAKLGPARPIFRPGR